ncbi:MAG: cytochrome-c oxidase, cbb3-type subunit III [Gammaproteobacteria bacterium]|jgi:cytochrome c oxidase cbb3-type subunit 3
MSDFTSDFWSWWITAIVLGGIFWCIWLLLANSKSKLPAGSKAKATGHVWDENLEELNNPLPRWWMLMFYITIAFGLAYLALYPGLGTYAGVLGWTEKGQYESEIAAADTQYGPLYDKYMNEDIPAIAADQDAINMGERLYVNYCAVCHGSDARGAAGFPNLRDSDWLYGGTPEAIKHSIMSGRRAIMPAWEDILGGEEGVEQVATYVMKLAGREVDEALAKEGKEKFYTNCSGCHLEDGTGNIAVGAPNLTNNIWLYGGSPRAIKESIAKGRQGVMPAHAEFLGEAKVHVLTAYIYSLSHEVD